MMMHPMLLLLEAVAPVGLEVIQLKLLDVNLALNLPAAAALAAAISKSSDRRYRWSWIS